MSGFSGFDPLDVTQGERQQGSILGIVVIGFCVLIEVILLIMVVTSSLRDYRRSNRSCSCFGFFQTLAVMRKCFLATGLLITLNNSLYWIQLIIPIKYNDQMCFLTMKVNGRFLYMVCMCAVYLCLWIRQYSLHQSPVLRTAIPKWFYILSKSSLVLGVLAMIFPLVIDISYENGQLFWGPPAKFSNNTCFYESKKTPALLPYINGAGSVLTQICYMVLFCKTLQMHRENNKNATENNSKKSKLKQLAKRCLCFTLITIMTDCAFFIVLSQNFVDKPLEIVDIAGRINLMLNMVCLLFCFNKLPNAIHVLLHIFSCGKWKMTKEDNEK